MKRIILTVLLIVAGISNSYSQNFTGKVLDMNGNPVDNAKIHLSFTYSEKSYSFFDYVTDSGLYNPVFHDTHFRYQLPEKGTVNFVVLNRKTEPVRVLVDNEILPAGFRTIFFDRMSDDGLIMKDDIYTNTINLTFQESPGSLSGSKDIFMLSGLSESVLFDPDHTLEPWTNTDASGNFAIPVEDLPIGMGITVEFSNGFSNSSVIDSLIGIAAVKGTEFHYDSLRIQIDNNYIEMVLDKVTSIESEYIENDIPQGYSLSQNFPNPFNPVTTIKYQIPHAGHISLRIFNIAGQEVRTLTNGQKSAGNHNVQWDGTDNLGNPVSSGIYLYRMEMSTGYVQARKMVFLK